MEQMVSVIKPKAKGKAKAIVKKKKLGKKSLQLLEAAKEYLPPDANLSLETVWHTRVTATFPTLYPPGEWGACYDEEKPETLRWAYKACIWWCWNSYIEKFPDEQIPYDFTDD